MKVGSKVRYWIGNVSHTAKLIEDRGLIGIGGRRIWRLRESGTEVICEFELPEVSLEEIDDIPVELKPSNKRILRTYAGLGHISVLAQYAKKLGFSFVSWNDKIYNITGATAIDTGLTESDFPE